VAGFCKFGRNLTEAGEIDDMYDDEIIVEKELEN
jgi:hypothetical protein